MATSPPKHLTPRKRPRQARAAATLDAVFEATIQVLVTDGPHRLTTTRVAERASLSAPCTSIFPTSRRCSMP